MSIRRKGDGGLIALLSLAMAIGLVWSADHFLARPRAQGIGIPNTFVNLTTADADQVNANFAALAANALNRNGGILGGTLNLNGQTLSGAAAPTGAWTFTTAPGFLTPLALASGGTNSTASATNGGVGYGTGTAHAFTAAGTSGQVLTSTGAGAPAFGWVQATATITTTGTQTALALPPGGGPLVIFANNATLLTLQGITAGVDGQTLAIYSVGAGQVDLANQNGSATAALRIINGVTGTISLAPGAGRVLLQYDATTARWRVLQHEQGAWITPTFAAGDYTAATGNFTLAGGDVLSQKYYLRGRQITVAFVLATTTVSATPSALYIGSGAWGGFTTASATLYSFLLYNDNGGGNTQGYVSALGSDTKLALSKNSGNWSTATDTSGFFGQITFEVQ